MLQLAAFDRRIKAVSIVASGLNLADTLLEMLGKEGFVNFLKEFNNAGRDITTQEKSSIFML